MHADTDSLDGAGTRRVTASALAKRDASVTEELPDAVLTGLAFYKAHIVAFGVEGSERLSRTARLGFEDFVEPLLPCRDVHARGVGQCAEAEQPRVVVLQAFPLRWLGRLGAWRFVLMGSLPACESRPGPCGETAHGPRVGWGPVPGGAGSRRLPSRRRPGLPPRP